ncbi:MAG: hypothetical protein RR265_08695, partial [Cetobacterium sp.]
VENLDIKLSKGEILQFNLNKSNDELYYIILKEHEVQNEAEFFRNIFFKYLDNPRYIREQILFSEIFEKLEIALKEKKKVNIKFFLIVKKMKIIETIELLILKIYHYQNMILKLKT